MSNSIKCPKCKHTEFEKSDVVYKCKQCGYTMDVKIKNKKVRNKIFTLDNILDVLEVILDIID